MTDIKFLPTTAITSMVMNSDVFAYAQTYSGNLYELKGSMRTISGIPVYKYNSLGSAFAVIRLEDDELAENAPKLFTPVAAAPFAPSKSDTKNSRYLFYVDDKNILHDVYNSGSGWTQGNLAALNVQCAHYSRLAAITVVNDLYNFMCLYYQAPTSNAAIKMVSYSGGTRQWSQGSPNLTDPPLFGTSLTAVPPRNGILVGTNPGTVEARQPVYYLQMDTLQLGNAQGTSDPVVMAGLELDGKALVFSPHTSLTAVDNGSHLYIIYKSNSGKVKVIEIVEGKPKPPEQYTDIDTTPMSAIAACLAPNTSSTQIILFFQSLNQSTMQVNLGVSLLSKAQTNSTSWTVSKSVKIGG